MPSYTDCRILSTSHAVVGDTGTVRAEIYEQLSTYKRVVDTVMITIPNFSIVDATETGVKDHVLQVYNAAQV